jgi:hypothetical protein
VSINKVISNVIVAGKEDVDSYGRPRNKHSKTLWPKEASWLSVTWNPKARFPQLDELIEALNSVKTVIAGGSILGCIAAIRFNDIDLFPFKEAAVEETKNILSKLGYSESYSNKCVLGYSHRSNVYKPVQLLCTHTDAGSPEEVLRRFDLSIVQFGVQGGKVVTNSVSQADLKSKTLRVVGTVSINSMIKRVEKYKRRGFKVLDE